MRYLLLKIFNIAVGIDKDEKKPFDTASLDDRVHLTHLENIRNAGNKAELQRLYLAALKDAELIGDAGSIQAFIRAKDERLRVL
jgi:hypothetical protein